MAKWTLPEGKIYTQADLDAAVVAALREAAKVMGDYHWHRYASREEGGQLSSPAVFTSHTHQAAQELILALIPDAGAALDRALAEALKPYRIALADAIRRPMGVVPASDEGLVTTAEMDAAEQRRAAAIRAQGET